MSKCVIRTVSSVQKVYLLHVAGVGILFASHISLLITTFVRIIRIKFSHSAKINVIFVFSTLKLVYKLFFLSNSETDTSILSLVSFTVNIQQFLISFDDDDRDDINSDLNSVLLEHNLCQETLDEINTIRDLLS